MVQDTAPVSVSMPWRPVGVLATSAPAEVVRSQFTGPVLAVHFSAICAKAATGPRVSSKERERSSPCFMGGDFLEGGFARIIPAGCSFASAGDVLAGMLSAACLRGISLFRVGC